ncbi:MAG: response regulator [Lachnospiraceae bacterium]|nr:response regulator [Lachnospiraceae bacterium]
MNEQGTEQRIRNEIEQASHLLLLCSYTILALALVVVDYLFSWEPWAIPLIVVGVLYCWYIHIFSRQPADFRLWLYVILISITFFFYGSHRTSLFDLSLIITYFITLLNITGKERYLLFCQVSYYLTVFYNVIMMWQAGVSFTPLVNCRLVLHVLIITMYAYISRMTIRKRSEGYTETDQIIGSLKGDAQSMDDFLTNVSHEIRTPINAVIGLTSVLQKRETEESVRQELGMVLNAGYKAAEQIGDILDYTEIDMNKLVVSNSVYTLSSLLNDLITGLKLQKHIRHMLIMDVDADVPAALIGDSEKIKKILRHLIKNGMRYTKRGGVYVHIFSMNRPYGVNFCMEVADTGIGMSGEAMGLMFDRIYQVESAKDRAAGSFGIGMTIVRGLVQSMGGFIHVDSEPNAGTTVTVSIPQKIADPAPCINLSNRESIRAGLYLRMARTDVPRAREYFNNMLSNFEKGLGITLHRSNSIADLKQYHEKVGLTHLITGDLEYLADSEYLEELSRRIQVIVVVEDDFTLEPGSHVHLLRRPFYGITAASLLNAPNVFRAELFAEEMLYLPGIRVLVVDDEPMNLAVAKGVFSDYGMSVTTAESGPEAVNLCRKQHFDLIFMDHIMPDMDGVEAMKLIRADAGKKDEDLIIIALTANVLSSTKEMLLSEGFDAFIPKPMEMPELERELRRLTKRLSRSRGVKL